jgi:hypothetical protein
MSILKIYTYDGRTEYRRIKSPLNRGALLGKIDNT